MAVDKVLAGQTTAYLMGQYARWMFECQRRKKYRKLYLAYKKANNDLHNLLVSGGCYANDETFNGRPILKPEYEVWYQRGKTNYMGVFMTASQVKAQIEKEERIREQMFGKRDV